jgi:hypothetical protein
LNWVLFPFTMWGLKWNKHKPMALFLWHSNFLSTKSQMSGRWGERRHCRWIRDGLTAICKPLRIEYRVFFYSFLFPSLFLPILMYRNLFLLSNLYWMYIFMSLKVLRVNCNIFNSTFVFSTTLKTYLWLFISWFLWHTSVLI